MKKIILVAILLFSFQIFSQTQDAWIFLKDKPNATSFIENPLTMLSQRAVDRRVKQQISFDEKDVPIYKDYYNQLKSDETLTILGKSKWLNAIHIQGIESDIKNLASKFTFIKLIEFANKSLNSKSFSTTKERFTKQSSKFKEITTDFTYGNTENQVKMLHVNYLHAQGFTGNGLQIAIIDAGFPNVNTLDGFKKIRDNNQILGGYNFADRNEKIYNRNSHGTHVLSTIAGYKENEFVGSAIDAEFYLFISEIAETETVLEETLWVEAAEKADSLGVDIINTSLGYTKFDNPLHNYTYSDMNGETTFISRGAKIGASRGMILVTSAGNSGNSDWKYISAPADVKDVFTIGAVNANENIASFSSIGPTSDDRIKPDVVAQGVNAAIINFSSDAISTSNGTSFSSPIMAGAIACFWQAFPDKTNFEIMDIIRNSSDRFQNPTMQYGFGIPNFETAYTKTLAIKNNHLLDFKVYPNPVSNSFQIFKSDENYTLEIYTILGKKVFHQKKQNTNTVDVSFLKNGIYILKIQQGNQQKTIKLIKQ